jgi:hydroxyacylglutathione hydrolase
MFIVQFVDEGLGNASHLVGSKEAKVAAVVDPLRDVDRYLATAERFGVRIAYALDTHLHNDFVSGAREIAAKTGAVVVAGADAGLQFDHRPVRDGDRLPFGDLAVSAIATPGHTPEHMAYGVGLPDAPTPAVLFSGGALIVGGCARTDLLGEDRRVPLARDLYRTVHGKLMKLPDAVAVYPTHGGGSFCAAPATDARTTTIGQERVTNPLARARTEDEFVARALSGLPSYPTYFGMLRPINQRGPPVLGGVPRLRPMSAGEVLAWKEKGGAVLDVRPPWIFWDGHVPGAYGIGVDAPLATWVGWLIPFGTPLVLVSMDPMDLEEAVRRLIRIGYDDLCGVLEGGMRAWQSAGLPVERVRTMYAEDLRNRLAGPDPPRVLDVRRDDEWNDGHIPGALHVENGRLASEDLPVPKDAPVVVHCHTGNRSTIGLSVLARRGYTNLALLDGGWAEWQASGYEVERP